MNNDKYYRSLLKRVEFLESKLYNRKTRIYEADVDGATKLYEDSDWVVYRITTPEAAKRYGKSASWDITAGRHSGQIFNDYIKNYNLDGGYYFYISKSDKSKQYCVLQTKGKKIKSIWDVKGEPIDFLDSDLPIVKGVKLNGIGDNDRLIKAVCDHDITAAKDLLNSNVDPNAETFRGTPVICIAAGELDYPMVSLLLKSGADPNAYDKVNGADPVTAALHNMKWNTNKATPEKNNVIKELLKYGAKVEQDALEKLCTDGNVQMVKLVLDNSDQIDLSSKFGSRLLWRASQFMTKGNLDVVELLLESGVNPNMPNSYGETLLQRALGWDQKNKSVAKYVKLLRQYGAE